MEETSQQIIAQKQVILRIAPRSGGNLNGKDVVFLMKEPGTDALVFDNGTYITREGFGSKKRLNQSGSYTAVIKKLGTSGYRPYNYFSPGVREQYEAQHKFAEQKKLKSQEVFPVVEKLNLRQLPSRLGYEQVSIQQPRTEISRTMIPEERRTGPAANERYIRQFADLLAEREKVVGRGPNIRYPTQYQILAPHQFAGWASREYGGVKKRRMELGLTRIPKTITKPGNKKLGKGRPKVKRGGDEYGDSFEE